MREEVVYERVYQIAGEYPSSATQDADTPAEAAQTVFELLTEGAVGIRVWRFDREKAVDSDEAVSPTIGTAA